MGRGAVAEASVVALANPVWEVAALFDVLPEPERAHALGFDWICGAAKAYRCSSGGSAHNTLAALSRIDGWVATAFGQVGQDDAGKRSTEALRELGVEPCFAVASQRRTKTSAVLVEASTLRSYYLAWTPSGCVDHPTEALVHRSTLESSTLVHIDRPSAPHLELARGRVARGLAFSIDLATWPRRPEAARRAFELVRHATVAKLAGLAADGLAAQLNVDASAGLLGRALDYRGWGLVVTRGAAGATAWSPEEHSETNTEIQQSAATAEAIEPSGSGDAYVSGLLQGWISGRRLSEALPAAVGRAANAVQHVGPTGWLTDPLQQSE